MVARLPTSSALERAARCPGSLRLPVIHEESEPAAQGTAIHAFLADALAVGRDAALERVSEDHRPACEVIDPALVEMLDPATMAAEVSLAYSLDLDIGRELGRNLGRDDAYRGAQPGEFVGTADLLWLDGEDGVVVLDHKTGRGHVAPAAKNWQLRSLAVYAAATYNRTRARVGLVHARPGEDARFDMADLDALELAEARGQLADLIARTQDPDAPRVMGAHCRYCPSFSYCPEQHALLRVAIEKPAHLDGLQEAALSVEDRAKAHQIWQAVKTLASRLGDRVNAVASYEPIPLGEGRMYGFADGPERISDPALAKAVLAEVVNDEAAALAVTVSTELSATKGSVEAALKAGKLRPADRARVFEALRKRGALKKTQTLREFNAGDKQEGT